MKNQMKEYEEFLEEEIKKGNKSEELLRFHCEMVHCFQHERLVHMIIMFVFVLLALGFLGLTGLVLGNCGDGVEYLTMLPLFLITLIITILAICYVKYYFFLENHVQALYRKTAILSGFNTEKRKNS